MNTCSNCGKMTGLHGSVLQGCMCQYSTPPMREGKDFTISKPWVGLTDEEIKHTLELFVVPPHHVEMVVRAIEAKLKEKNT